MDWKALLEADQGSQCNGTKSVEFLKQAFAVIFGKSFQSLFFLAGWNGSELVEAGETILELCTPASAPG